MSTYNSTYNCLCTCIKENVMRVRNPGNDDDGICPDRLIFTNGENIYKGTLVGAAKLSSYSISNCKLSDTTFYSSVLTGDESLSFSIDDIVKLSDDAYSSISTTNAVSGAFDALSGIDTLSSFIIDSQLTDVANAVICIRDTLSAMYMSFYDAMHPVLPPSSDHASSDNNTEELNGNTQEEDDHIPMQSYYASCSIPSHTSTNDELYMLREENE